MARSRRCQGPHTHPARGRQETVNTVAKTSFPPPSRGPPRRRPPYMTPQAPRRSLPQSVSGPGSRAPPAASSSAGHRVRHLPSSPRMPIAAQSLASKTWLPSGPARRGSASPAPSFRELCARSWGGGAEGLGRVGAGGPRGQATRLWRKGEGSLGPSWEGRARRRTQFAPCAPAFPVGAGSRAPPPHRHTPRVKTSQ